MAKVFNPFIVAGRIDPRYFCDREQESRELIKLVTNGNNLVLISPRRMGKTGLIQHCYDDEAIKDDYITIYVDILATTSLREFTYVLGRHIYEALLTRGQRFVQAFVAVLKSLSGKFGFDPIMGGPTFNMELGDISHPELTLREIFHYLDHASQPCIVAINEFQQIGRYPEQNIEALLRSHIQQMSNVRFIFAGSDFHMMQEMFASATRLFYNSADMMVLDAIPVQVYIDFVERLMAEGDRTIAPELVEDVYRMFSGNTYAMQRTFNEVYARTEPGDECSVKVVDDALVTILYKKEAVYRQMLSNVSDKYKPLLYSIAAEGNAERITSMAYVTRHKLASASAVQYAAQQLIEQNLVSRRQSTYSINDPFFALWINRNYGTPTLLGKPTTDN